MLFSLPIMFPSPPQWTQGPGNWGTQRDRNAVIFGIARTGRVANCPRASTQTLTWGHTRTHTRTHSSAQSLCCDRASTYRTKGALARTCHSSPGIWLKWAGYRTLSSRRWGGFCHSRAVFWKGRRERENFIRNEQLVSACARARVFLSLTWLPVQHWAGQLDYHWWHSVKPGSNVSGA